MQIEPEKERALKEIFEFIKLRRKQFITLGGYAGTGKTFLLSLFRKKLFDEYPKLRVAFCSFTGKASQVLALTLRSQKSIFKGDKVSTIHSLIYEPQMDSKGEIVAWNKREKIDFDIIVIDEASMVSSDIWKDLLSYKLPILAVGDHGQLPPVGTNFNLMDNPELKLEKIFRQEKGSAIIKLSEQVRKTGKIPIGKLGNGVVKYDKRDMETASVVEDLLRSWNEETMFLVGMNKTRIKLNQEIRIYRDIIEMSPTLGDRVICLKNNWKLGIYNGMLGTIADIRDECDKYGEKHWYETDIMMDDGIGFSGRISTHQFNKESTLREVKGLSWKEIGQLFDFGYALTVHKAQGSQARTVVVFEERNRYLDDEEWRRWLYTAVTRAMEELVIIGD
jgi:exodeoxyribonuclease-5